VDFRRTNTGFIAENEVGFFPLRTRTQDFVTENGKVFSPGELVPKNYKVFP
jgi:hypothetical protein